MNKFLLAGLIMIIAIFCVSTASATITVTTTIDKDNPGFGSATTDASNPNADSTSDENIYDPGSIILNNNAASDVIITSIAVTPVSGFSNTDPNSAGYINVTMTNSPLTVPANGNATATFNARIPETLDAVDSDGDPVAFNTATVTLSDGTSNVGSFTAYMQRENKLEIEKIYAIIDGSSDSYSKSGKTVDVERMDSVEVSIKLENIYDKDDGDLKIEDIEIVASFNDEDIAEDENDVEDIEEDCEDLDEEEKSDTIELMSFEVNEEADGSYDGEIYVTGEDEHGALHGEKWDIEFDVEVETHDLRITKATFSQNNLSCDRTTILYIDGINIGKRDEEEVVLTVINSDLGISEYKEYDEVEKPGDDNDFSASFAIDVDDDLSAGTYPIYIKLYRDANDLEYSTAINLIIKACTPAATTTTDSTSTTVVSDSTTTTAEEDEEEETITTETSFFESPTYSGLLIGINVIAILAVVALAIIFLKPRP